MRPQETLIASFGGAQILKHLNGKLEIRGGTEDEKAKAHDWMRRFLFPNQLQAIVLDQKGPRLVLAEQPPGL